MGYKALITIDLTDIDNQTREEFYKVLEEEQWYKIKTLTTSWKVSFDEKATRSGAISALENDLKKAKTKSKATNVEYAIQLEKEEIKIGSISQ